MMYLTEQKTERLINLSKKDLMIMLEPYTDDSLICIGLQMQQGYVGFFDLEQDTKHTDRYEFVLNSDCFNEWYKKDIAELKEKIGEQQATISKLEEENEQLRQELEENKSIINFCSNGDEDEDLHRLIKENEQLRNELYIVETDCKNVKESRNHYREENEKLKEDNEQLKKQLEIRTESDKYHQRMLMKWLCKDDGDGV